MCVRGFPFRGAGVRPQMSHGLTAWGRKTISPIRVNTENPHRGSVFAFHLPLQKLPFRFNACPFMTATGGFYFF